MEITVTATVSLTFDTNDGLVGSEQEAIDEMVDYLATGPIVHPDYITVTKS